MCRRNLTSHLAEISLIEFLITVWLIKPSSRQAKDVAWRSVINLISCAQKRKCSLIRQKYLIRWVVLKTFKSDQIAGGVK